MKKMLALIAPLLFGISLNAAPYQGNVYTTNTTAQANAAAAPVGVNVTTAGSANTAVGSGAFQLAGGNDNSAFGLDAVQANMTGTGNSGFGYQALIGNLSGSFNIGIGYGAGSALLLSSNIDIGNFGLAGDVQVIRIGSGQLTTYIAGAITGNGGGLTNLNANQFTNGIGYLGTNSAIPIIPSGLDPTGTNLYSSALISGSLTNQGSMTASNGFASYAQHVPAAVTVGASPFSYTNVSPIAQSCYLSGATAYAVALNGVTVYASLAGDSYVMLQPTNVVKVTYTVAPTLLTNSW